MSTRISVGFQLHCWDLVGDTAKVREFCKSEELKIEIGYGIKQAFRPNLKLV